MSGEMSVRPPRSFRIVSVVALLWNLVGVASYLVQVTMTEQAMAAMPEAERMLYENIPAWATAAFAVAVFAGALGSLLLLMRKALAVPILVVSLVGVIVQMCYSFLLADTVAVMGAQAVVLPLLVLMVAVFLVRYAHRAKARGWLS